MTPEVGELYAALVNVGELLTENTEEVRALRLELQRVRLAQLAFEGRIVELDKRVTTLEIERAEAAE